MIGVKLNDAKSMFFDSKRITSAVDKASRKVLSKFGSHVRTTAMRSIRKAPYAERKKRGQERTDFSKKVSEPGNPPFSRTGLLKKFIFFGYDLSQESVVIGPVKLNQKSGVAPELLESGGTTTRRFWKWVGYRKGELRRRQVKVRPRPYMGPALKENLPDLPDMWENSVK